MSSLIDIPAQLALVLQLTAAAAGGAAPSPQPAAEALTPASQGTLVLATLDGPFRFSERNWLRALKEGVQGEDAADFSGSIFQTSSGRYYVPAAAERSRILEARRDDAMAGRVARAFADRNAERIGHALQRSPRAGELYLAHVFGPEAAISFIKLAEAKPGDSALARMPELAQSAPEILGADGATLTLQQAYKRLVDPLDTRPAGVGLLPAASASDRAILATLILKPTLAYTSRRGARSPVLVSDALTRRAEPAAVTPGAPPQ